MRNFFFIGLLAVALPGCDTGQAWNDYSNRKSNEMSLAGAEISTLCAQGDIEEAVLLGGATAQRVAQYRPEPAPPLASKAEFYQVMFDMFKSMPGDCAGLYMSFGSLSIRYWQDSYDQERYNRHQDPLGELIAMSSVMSLNERQVDYLLAKRRRDMAEN